MTPTPSAASAARRTSDPYALQAEAFPAPGFTLSSDDVGADGTLPSACYARGGGLSPALSWTGLPPEAASLLITAFDADSPVPGGFWHWLLLDVPASAGGLPTGAGSPGGALPAGSRSWRNDLGSTGYCGVNPPPGTGTHRLFLAATALDVPHLDVPAAASAAMVHVLAIPHTVARAVLVATSTAPRSQQDTGNEE